jgi:hypothetical protein
MKTKMNRSIKIFASAFSLLLLLQITPPAAMAFSLSDSLQRTYQWLEKTAAELSHAKRKFIEQTIYGKQYYNKTHDVFYNPISLELSTPLLGDAEAYIDQETRLKISDPGFPYEYEVYVNGKPIQELSPWRWGFFVFQPHVIKNKDYFRLRYLPPGEQNIYIVAKDQNSNFTVQSKTYQYNKKMPIMFLWGNHGSSSTDKVKTEPINDPLKDVKKRQTLPKPKELKLPSDDDKWHHAEIDWDNFDEDWFNNWDDDDDDDEYIDLY